MASTPTEVLLKAYEGLTPSAVVETSDGDQRPLCNEEAFEPALPLRPSAPAAAMLAAPPSAAAPVMLEEDDLTKAKRIVREASDATPPRTSVRRRR